MRQKPALFGAPLGRDGRYSWVYLERTQDVAERTQTDPVRPGEWPHEWGVTSRHVLFATWVR
jgi:hypothetical protein